MFDNKNEQSPGKTRFTKKTINSNQEMVNCISLRHSHGHGMIISTSNYQHYKLKDMLLLYFYMSCIPIGLIVAYCNIFIGSAKLREIPEGYQPKPWEYYEHPIERFFAKYLTFTPQELHERNMHTLFLQNEKTMIRKLEAKVQNLVKERQDFQSWYFEAPNTRYVRQFDHHSETTMKGGKAYDTLL
ncbi:hypothetical protein RUM44_002173 [Polyplax serrata]|uniref:NADH dehydrogenase [ubiquinone] 1 beta subcomplex subunit 5, mitochondrial n=1 Tax=Polyplax serrata TaxID=468196 RepID=A0ABR1AM53_POLSC